MGKLYEKSLTFFNNWKNPDNNKSSNFKVSIVIPVYHPKYLLKVLNHLSKLENIYEVILVFDGLDDSPEEIIGKYNFNLTVIKHKENYNAPAANNTGAVYATGDILLFLDQDMILSPNFIPNALKFLQANGNRAIVLGFRDTVEVEDVPTLENWKESNYKNDWRIKTDIDENFLDLTVSNCGSVNNNCNKNCKLEIYKKTNGFRTLGTKSENTMGFWDLPCMVISHTLAITKKDFFEIGGYPEWVKGWGGEDIALGFLATANHLPIIPIEVGSYHIKHDPLSGSEEKKWTEMRENLKIYKAWSSTIDDFPIIDRDQCISRSTVIYKNTL